MVSLIRNLLALLSVALLLSSCEDKNILPVTCNDILVEFMVIVKNADKEPTGKAEVTVTNQRTGEELEGTGYHYSHHDDEERGEYLLVTSGHAGSEVEHKDILHVEAVKDEKQGETEVQIDWNDPCPEEMRLKGETEIIME